MQTVCKILEQWHEETMLSITPNKTEIILFTHKTNLTKFKPPTTLFFKPEFEQVIRKETTIIWQLGQVVGIKTPSPPLAAYCLLGSGLVTCGGKCIKCHEANWSAKISMLRNRRGNENYLSRGIQQPTGTAEHPDMVKREATA